MQHKVEDAVDQDRKDPRQCPDAHPSTKSIFGTNCSSTKLKNEPDEKASKDQADQARVCDRLQIIIMGLLDTLKAAVAVVFGLGNSKGAQSGPER